MNSKAAKGGEKEAIVNTPKNMTNIWEGIQILYEARVFAYNLLSNTFLPRLDQLDTRRNRGRLYDLRAACRSLG